MIGYFGTDEVVLLSKAFNPDGKDLASFYLLGTYEDALVAYLRLLPRLEANGIILFGHVISAYAVRQ